MDNTMGDLFAMAQEEIDLEGDWSVEVANERCQEYARLIRRFQADS